MTEPTGTAEARPTLESTPEEAFQRLCQEALDAATDAEPSRQDVAIAAVGIADIRATLKTMSLEALETLSVRSSVNAESLVLNHDVNVRLAAAGKQGIGLFDYDTTEPAARHWLSSVQGANYRYCRGAAGLQFKVFDRRMVVISGPRIRGDQSLLRITHPDTVQTGVALVRKLIRGSFPVTCDHEPGSDITPRQWRIAVLMANDLTDQAIAERLGVSLRTVRSDIAGLLRGLGVQSRYAAGIRVSELGMVQNPWPASDVRVPRPSS